MPFKQSLPPLPDNYEHCEARLCNKLKELRKKPELLKQYDAVFREQKRPGIIAEVNNAGEVGKTNYLPHHHVVKPGKKTTKLRVVFDASCRKNGPSLNEGPNMTPLLYDILIRFRYYPVALTADIEKPFLQISVANEDLDFLRFLWVENVFNRNRKKSFYPCSFWPQQFAQVAQWNCT